MKSKHKTEAFRCVECGTLVMPDPYIIENALKCTDNGDLNRARRLFQIAIAVGIEPEYSRDRMLELDCKPDEKNAR